MSSVTTTQLSEDSVKKSWKWRGVLGAREIATSSDLLRRLEARGLSPATARQALSRDFKSTNGIWRSERLRLEGGGRLYAYKSFFGESAFLADLQAIVSKQRRGLSRVIAAIGKFDAIDEVAVAKLTAVEVGPDGNLSEEMRLIEEAGLGSVEDSGTGQNRLVRSKFAHTTESESLGFQLLAEGEAERRWVSLLLLHLSCQNLIAWRSHSHKRSYVFNRRVFSAIGYSYVRPLVRFNRNDPRPIACPVAIDVLARPAEIFDVEGFLDRMSRAGANPRGKLRLLGVMGAPIFTPEAFELAKSKGLMLVSFREVFGESALKLMESAKSLFEEMETAGHAETSAGRLSRLAHELSESIAKLKNHPLVTALSGLAFEAFAAAVMRSEGFENVRSGEEVPFNDGGIETMREVDVNGHIGDRWWIIECKALNAQKELETRDVKKFFTETVPALIKLKGRSNVASCRAQLWTTGLVTAEVRHYLENTIRVPRGVSAEICTRDQIQVPRSLRPLGRILQVLAAL